MSVPAIRPARSAPRDALLDRWLGGDAWIAERLGGHPFDPQALDRAIGEFARREYDRAAIVRVLEACNEKPSPATRRSIESASDPSVLFVSTGQQPGLLGGPLYTLLKACTAIALARALAVRTGRRFVPLFWVASNDHDLAEIESCQALTDEGDVRRHRVPLGPVGTPSSRIVVPPSAVETFAGFAADLPDGPGRDQVIALAAPVVGETWPRWFERIIAALFPESGLVLFEPERASPLFHGALRDEAGRAPNTAAALQLGGAHLAERGLAVPLPVDAPSALFHLRDGRRVRFDASDGGRAELLAQLESDPSAVSADAGFRPILQSLTMPTPIYVGGPGELAYWLQLREAFAQANAPQPLFFPRLSATLVDARLRRALAAEDLDETALFAGEAALLERRLAAAPAREMDPLRAKSDEAASALDRFGDALEKLGGNLPARVRELKGVYRKSLDKLLAQAQRQALEREGSSERRLQSIARSALPGGKLQERVLNGLPFAARHGSDVFEQLAARLDPFMAEHQIIDVDRVSADAG